MNADGTFTYVPNPGFYGTDSFTYQLFDGVAYSNVATVTITVGYTDIPPMAENDAYTLTQNTPLDGHLNRRDQQNFPLQYLMLQQPGHGHVTLTDPMNGAFTYYPAPNAAGADSFTFLATDGQQYSNAIGTINLVILPVRPRRW